MRHSGGLASLGHHVLGIDRDKYKVDNVIGGRAPFYEPGLENWVGEVVRRADCPPQLQRGWNRECRHRLWFASERRRKRMEIWACRSCAERWRRSRHAIPGRSKPMIDRHPQHGFPRNVRRGGAAGVGRSQASERSIQSEFLREGSAVQDFMEPSLLVVGGANGRGPAVADLYAPLRRPSACTGVTAHRGDDQVRLQRLPRDQDFFRK